MLDFQGFRRINCATSHLHSTSTSQPQPPNLLNNPSPGLPYLHNTERPATCLQPYSAIFPAELLIQVYKSLDNVKDITALNLASHQFYDLWSSHTLSISDAVFSGTIKSFDDARELAELQQNYFGRNHWDDNGHHDPYLEALERNKLMVFNAHNYLDVCEEGISLRPFERWINPNEPILSRVYYCIWKLVLMEEDTFAQSSCLASLDLKNLEVMVEIIVRDMSPSFLFPGRDGFNDQDPPRFALKQMGGKSPEHALLNVLNTLRKHIWH